MPAASRTAGARCGDGIDPVRGGLGDQDGHGDHGAAFGPAGEVHLHQPLTEVLPTEHRTSALTGAHTLHHLLSHTSGLPNYHDDEAVTRDSFLSCWDRLPCQLARRPADLLPLFRHLPAAAPPGQRFSYADANYILAGLVIEAVTGKPYAEAATEEVLKPAGMDDSGFDLRDADPPRLATGYLYEEDAPFESRRANVFSAPAGGMPDGGLITTTTDLSRLVDALVGGRLVSPQTFTVMTSPQCGRTDGVDRYGYGLQLGLIGSEFVVLGTTGSTPAWPPSWPTTLPRPRRSSSWATTTAAHSRSTSGSWPTAGSPTHAPDDRVACVIRPPAPTPRRWGRAGPPSAS
jgi:CubicO group peptidase (beta-lactamase class C family)